MQRKNKTGKANVSLSLIGKLYGIEASLKDKTAAEKYQTRQEKTHHIINKLHHWVIENKDKVPPKSKLVEALIYWCNQEHKLITYLKDGRINIDNNRAERAMKPFFIGRKNWLLSNTARGQRLAPYSIALLK